MDVELRPVGLCFAFVGNLAFAFGFGGSIGALQSADFANVSAATALQFGSPLALLGFGYLLIRLAPRFGGGSFGVQFLVIGITSLVGALHATDGTERFVGFMIGGTFLATSLFGLLAAGLTMGWRHSLLHAGPVISVRGAGGAQPLNVNTFADAVRVAQKLQGGPQPSPAMFTVDMLQPEQRQQILDESETLRSSGKISEAQHEAIQQWSGLRPKAPELGTPPAMDAVPPVTTTARGDRLGAMAGIFRRLPVGLKVALPICLFVGTTTLLAIRHDNAHPDSDTVEKIGQEAIPQQTGQEVGEIDCDKVVDITFARQIHCHVELADGTTYDTIASVRKRGGQNKSPGTISASFTLPPSADTPTKSHGEPPTDAVECVQAAGTDTAKLQACAAQF